MEYSTQAVIYISQFYHFIISDLILSSHVAVSGSSSFNSSLLIKENKTMFLDPAGETPGGEGHQDLYVLQDCQG